MCVQAHNELVFLDFGCLQVETSHHRDQFVEDLHLCQVLPLQLLHLARLLYKGTLGPVLFRILALRTAEQPTAVVAPGVKWKEKVQMKGMKTGPLPPIC